MAEIVVVGGGVAGLVAARELAIGGASVTLLEASGSLGGRVVRHSVAGIDLDAGAESFATRGGTVADYLGELGLADAIVAPNPAGAWLYRTNGQAVPLPKTGVLGIPGVPLARDVIAVIGTKAALRAELDVLLPGTIGAKERTLGALVRRRMGTGVLDELVAPVAAGIHSKHPDELELDVVVPGLRAALLRQGSLARAVQALRHQARAGSSVAGLSGGMYRLVEALLTDLDRPGVTIRTDARVQSVAPGGVTLADGRYLSADRVVLAASLASASSASRQIVLATLVVDCPELDAAPRGTGLLVAAGAPGIRAKALTHASVKWPWLAEQLGPHRHVLRLSYNSAPESGLAELARTDAEKLLGVAIPPAAVVGFARVRWSLTEKSAPLEGVTQVGEGSSGTGLAAVIGQARRQAGSLLEDVDP